MRKGFTLIEIIFVITLLSVLFTIFIPKKINNDLILAKNRLILYLKYLRFKAFIDNKNDLNNNLWYMKRWTLKFRNCNNRNGIYYLIYSDANQTGIPSRDESLKDPLSNKAIFSSGFCKETKENSKYVLLSKNFNIDKVKVSCNKTDSLGQISFSSSGKVYSKLSKNQSNENDYELEKKCTITLFHKNKTSININIENKTSYIY